MTLCYARHCCCASGYATILLRALCRWRDYLPCLPLLLMLLPRSDIHMIYDAAYAFFRYLLFMMRDAATLQARDIDAMMPRMTNILYAFGASCRALSPRHCRRCRVIDIADATPPPYRYFDKITPFDFRHDFLRLSDAPPLRFHATLIVIDYSLMLPIRLRRCHHACRLHIMVTPPPFLRRPPPLRQFSYATPFECYADILLPMLSMMFAACHAAMMLMIFIIYDTSLRRHADAAAVC